MTSILEDLRWRGILAQSTDPEALEALFDAGPVTFYVGFDPTAPSLHVGHLMQVLTAHRLQQAGHRPLLLVGGATGLIGDPRPTGAERTLNDLDVVAGWVRRIEGQLRPYVSFEGPAAAQMVNNLDWTSQLTAIDLLRSIGKHFSVNRMLAKDSVSARLEAGGISYTEFSYQVLQSNDFLELHRRHGCVLQTGGSDQWGNITAGVDLVRRVTGTAVHALTTTLVTKSDGTKFGKTEGGAVWLDPTMTSPYAFYQFWLNADDRDATAWLRRFSLKIRDEIEAIEALASARPPARIAQRALADELTELVHGQQERDRAVAAGAALFGQGDLHSLDAPTLTAALAELPGLTLTGPMPALPELLADTSLVSSRSAGRRAVQEGGAYVNNVKISDVEHVPAVEDLLHGRWLVLRRGKRNLAAVDTGGGAPGAPAV